MPQSISKSQVFPVTDIGRFYFSTFERASGFLLFGFEQSFFLSAFKLFEKKNEKCSLQAGYDNFTVLLLIYATPLFNTGIAKMAWQLIFPQRSCELVPSCRRCRTDFSSVDVCRKSDLGSSLNMLVFTVCLFFVTSP